MLLNQGGCIGARMMGGGFGGRSLNIIRRKEINKLVEQVTIANKKQTGINMHAIVVHTSGGTEITSGKEHATITY